MRNYSRVMTRVAGVLSGFVCLMILCSCMSTSHEAAPLSYGQTTCKIKVVKNKTAPHYGVSGTIFTEEYSADTMQKTVEEVKTPVVSIDVNRWGGIRLGKANKDVAFETSLYIDGELIKITHCPGILLKVKLTEKDKSTVKVSGVMLMTAIEGGKPAVKMYPIAVDCKLNSEVCFYSQKTSKPESAVDCKRKK